MNVIEINPRLCTIATYITFFIEKSDVS